MSRGGRIHGGRAFGSGLLAKGHVVTTEDEFHAKLIERPDDWQTRLVLADWLAERGDPRADGYRVLGRHRMHAFGNIWYNAGTAKWTRLESVGSAADLWGDWYFLLAGHHKWSRNGTRQFRDRREAEDAAALAFLRLPPERRAELLAGGVAV